MLGLTFSSKLDWGSYIISIAKTASKKIGALIRSMTFLSPEVDLYIYKSTIHPCIEYCRHIWAGAPSCYLELLGKLQKQICWTAVLHLLPLLNFQLIIDTQPVYVFSISITLVGVHLNWLNWFHFFILGGGLLVILIDCMIFLPPFLDVTRISMSTVSFLATLQPWTKYLRLTLVFT